ncbi:hypothetical protein C8J57DRAFT_462204 [Mycena rebaudengoi]|nr:hypothetical protein C8J57DRAFT_462204 [Mycena rebaudengoi]
MPAPHNFQPFQAAVDLMVTKLAVHRASAVNTQLRVILQALSATLQSASSRLTEYTAVDSDTARIANLMYGMAEIITHRNREDSLVEFFAQVYFEDLIRLLADVRANSDTSPAGQQQYRSRLAAELVVMEKELLIESVAERRKLSSNISSDVDSDTSEGLGQKATEYERRLHPASKFLGESPSDSTGPYIAGPSPALQMLVDSYSESETLGRNISTFVIYTPSEASSTSESGASTALPQEDLQNLENQFRNGGTVISVHYPRSAVLWIETHYSHRLITSIRSHGLGGPIASMLSPETQALNIFGSILDSWVLRAAKLLADLSKFAVIIRPLTHNPVPKWVGQHHTQSRNPSSDAVQQEKDRTVSQGGVLRLRGGADESEINYTSWMSPVHNLDVQLELRSAGLSYRVALITKLQVRFGMK